MTSVIDNYKLPPINFGGMPVIGLLRTHESPLSQEAAAEIQPHAPESSVEQIGALIIANTDPED